MTLWDDRSRIKVNVNFQGLLWLAAKDIGLRIPLKPFTDEIHVGENRHPPASGFDS